MIYFSNVNYRAQERDIYSPCAKEILIPYINHVSEAITCLWGHTRNGNRENTFAESRILLLVKPIKREHERKKFSIITNATATGLRILLLAHLTLQPNETKGKKIKRRMTIFIPK